MEYTEILSKLCYYDKRNPECLFDDETIADHQRKFESTKSVCYCDNCFCGRTVLAEELIKLKEQIFNNQYGIDSENFRRWMRSVDDDNVTIEELHKEFIQENKQNGKFK